MGAGREQKVRRLQRKGHSFEIVKETRKQLKLTISHLHRNDCVFAVSKIVWRLCGCDRCFHVETFEVNK